MADRVLVYCEGAGEAAADDDSEHGGEIQYGIAVVMLVMEGRMHGSDLVFAGTDLTLGVLFVIAYLETRSDEVRK